MEASESFPETHWEDMQNAMARAEGLPTEDGFIDVMRQQMFSQTAEYHWSGQSIMTETHDNALLASSELTKYLFEKPVTTFSDTTLKISQTGEFFDIVGNTTINEQVIQIFSDNNQLYTQTGSFPPLPISLDTLSNYLLIIAALSTGEPTSNIEEILKSVEEFQQGYPIKRLMMVTAAMGHVCGISSCTINSFFPSDLDNLIASYTEFETPTDSSLSSQLLLTRDARGDGGDYIPSDEEEDIPGDEVGISQCKSHIPDTTIPPIYRASHAPALKGCAERLAAGREPHPEPELITGPSRGAICVEHAPSSTSDEVRLYATLCRDFLASYDKILAHLY